jgi:hypothetical protein
VADSRVSVGRPVLADGADKKLGNFQGARHLK